MNIRPDPTFHASPKLAMEAPPESFAYTVLLSPDFSKPDALAVIDVKPGSSTYSQVVHTVTMPNKGDEFHHFGWNACSSSLSPLDRPRLPRTPLSHHPRHAVVPHLHRRYQAGSDQGEDPQDHRARGNLQEDRILAAAHVHCGPEGIYVSTLGGGGKDGTDGPPGVFIMDCETFEVLGRWEIDRGPQTTAL